MYTFVSRETRGNWGKRGKFCRGKNKLILTEVNEV